MILTAIVKSSQDIRGLLLKRLDCIMRLARVKESDLTINSCLLKSNRPKDYVHLRKLEPFASLVPHLGIKINDIRTGIITGASLIGSLPFSFIYECQSFSW